MQAEDKELRISNKVRDFQKKAIFLKREREIKKKLQISGRRFQQIIFKEYQSTLYANRFKNLSILASREL